MPMGRDRPCCPRSDRIESKSDLTELLDPIALGPAVHVMMPGLPRAAISHHQVVTCRKGRQEVVEILRLYVFDELTAPHKIERGIRNEAAFGVVMEDVLLRNPAVTHGLNAAVYGEDTATEVTEIACSMPFTAADIEDRTDGKLIEGPAPKLREVGGGVTMLEAINRWLPGVSAADVPAEVPLLQVHVGMFIALHSLGPLIEKYYLLKGVLFVVVSCFIDRI